jgi:hypothetical protein
MHQVGYLQRLHLEMHRQNINFSLSMMFFYSCRFKQLHLGNHSELATCSREFMFLTMADTLTCQNIDLSS